MQELLSSHINQETFERDLSGMKVLFVFPNIGYDGANPDLPTYGIAQMAAAIKKCNVDVKVLDMRLGYTNEDLFRLIDEFKPQLVGLTIVATRVKRSYDIMDEIKAKYPEIKIIAGGSHVASYKQKIFESCKSLDFAVKQEGEFVFLDILEAIKFGIPLDDIKGMIYRNSKGEVIETPDRPLIKDLDKIPFPDYDVFELDKYYRWKQGVMPIITSRGCPFHCVFCSIYLTMGRQFRFRSPENVVSEFEYWNKRGMNKFDINDDVFTILPKRVEEICDLIISKGLKVQLRLHNGVRVDEVTPELLRKMKQAGFTSLSFGIESGSEKVLKRMKKSINIDQARKAVQWSMDAGIETTVNFIIGHPEENYEDALETIKLAETLYADKINFNSAIPYPGTELYDWIKDNATFTKDVDEYLNNLSPGKVGEPFFYTKDFTKEQREELIERGLYNFRKRLIKTRFKEPFASVLALLARSDKMFTYMEVMKTKPAIINFVKPIITRRKGVNSALV